MTVNFIKLIFNMASADQEQVYRLRYDEVDEEIIDLVEQSFE